MGPPPTRALREQAGSGHPCRGQGQPTHSRAAEGWVAMLSCSCQNDNHDGNNHIRQTDTQTGRRGQVLIPCGTPRQALSGTVCASDSGNHPVLSNVIIPLQRRGHCSSGLRGFVRRRTASEWPCQELNSSCSPLTPSPGLKPPCNTEGSREELGGNLGQGCLLLLFYNEEAIFCCPQPSLKRTANGPAKLCSQRICVNVRESGGQLFLPVQHPSLLDSCGETNLTGTKWLTHPGLQGEPCQLESSDCSSSRNSWLRHDQAGSVCPSPGSCGSPFWLVAWTPGGTGKHLTEDAVDV